MEKNRSSYPTMKKRTLTDILVDLQHRVLRLEQDVEKLKNPNKIEVVVTETIGENGKIPDKKINFIQSSPTTMNKEEN